MTLDEYISRLYTAHAANLERLASATVSAKVEQAMAALLALLRGHYRLRPSAFSEELLNRIRASAKPGSNCGSAEVSGITVEGRSTRFRVDAWYLSAGGPFKVVSTHPFPRIKPTVYPTCSTPYFAEYMLEEHNRLTQERLTHLERANNFAEAFVLPLSTAEAELAEITEQYQAHLEDRHREFLQVHNLPQLGTRRSHKPPRVTHCYRCKTTLQSHLYKECCGCEWIICSCGACGCAYHTELTL